MVSMWVGKPKSFSILPSLLYYIFLDFLRRHLAGWHLWATRSDHPHIIIPAQAPKKRASVIRRHGRECRLGPRRGKGFPFFRYPEFPRQDLRLVLG